MKALWMRELPAGGRRPEPTVAALLANAVWSLFGCTANKWEPLGLNAWSGGVQIIGLLAFLVLCTRAERFQALRAITLASIYFAFALVFVIFFETCYLDLYQWICTIAGMVAAAAPLLTFLFLVEVDASDEMLPHGGILTFYAAHGFLWLARGLWKNNIYMWSQNLLLMVYAAFQLLLILYFPLVHVWEEEDGEGHGILAQVIVNKEQEPLPAPASRRRRRAEQTPATQNATGNVHPSTASTEITDHEDTLAPSQVPQITTQITPGNQNIISTEHLPSASETTNTTDVSSGKAPRRSARLASKAADKTPSKPTMTLRPSARRSTTTSGGESSSRTDKVTPGTGRKRKGPVTRESATPGRQSKSRKGDGGQRVSSPPNQ